MLLLLSHLTDGSTKPERDQVTSMWQQSGGERPKT